jgi:hypothetical protein
MEATSRKASDAIVLDAPLPEKRPSARATEPDKPAVHVHPSGIVEEVFGVDEQGRRQLRVVPDRTPTYISTCKGCQADDKARMAAPPSPKLLVQLEQTLFLIPEPEYDSNVARAYIKDRYPDAGNIVCSFHAEKLSYVKGAQVVVVTRRGLNGKQPGPRTKRTKDEEGTFYDAPIPPETYLAEIVESDHRGRLHGRRARNDVQRAERRHARVDRASRRARDAVPHRASRGPQRPHVCDASQLMTEHFQTLARRFIAHAKTIRPICAKCDRQPFYASLREPDGPEGYELEENFAGYVKRCEACASGKAYPWADRLDEEHVERMLKNDPRCRSAFAISIMRETLEE